MCKKEKQKLAIAENMIRGLGEPYYAMYLIRVHPVNKSDNSYVFPMLIVMGLVLAILFFSGKTENESKIQTPKTEMVDGIEI